MQFINYWLFVIACDFHSTYITITYHNSIYIYTYHTRVRLSLTSVHFLARPRYAPHVISPSCAVLPVHPVQEEEIHDECRWEQKRRFWGEARLPMELVGQ